MISPHCKSCLWERWKQKTLPAPAQTNPTHAKGERKDMWECLNASQTSSRKEFISLKSKEIILQPANKLWTLFLNKKKFSSSNWRFFSLSSCNHHAKFSSLPAAILLKHKSLCQKRWLVLSLCGIGLMEKEILILPYFSIFDHNNFDAKYGCK